LEGFNSSSSSSSSSSSLHTKTNNEHQTTTTTTTTAAAAAAAANGKHQNGSAASLFANQANQPQIGIGLDSCVIPLRHSGLSLIQTTDFFYPLIEDVRK
jgi:hypothetical protein